MLSTLLRHFEKLGERMPLSIAIKILDDLLAGLHYAHELSDPSGAHLKLVHRDVSPQNVMVGVDGLTRLLDFGVAKAVGRETRTETGAVKGKVAYMAPEQLRGRALDRRADVWAAGVVAWEMLAGRRLYVSNGDDIELAMRICAETPPRLESVRPHLPAAMSGAIASALTLSPEDRCMTAAELRRRLLNAVREDGVATTQEVGDLVHRLAGEQLRQRARHAAAVREARATGQAQARGTTQLAAEGGRVELATDTVRTPEARPSRIRVLALAAAGAALLVSAGIWTARSRLHAAVPDRLTASAVASPSASESPAVASSAPFASTSAADGAELVLSANVPIRSVDIAGRALVLAQPAAQVSVQLTPAERASSAPLVTVAVAVDGRRASTQVAPDATSASLTFAPPARERPSRSRTAGGTSPPLIGNPYGPAH